MLSPEEKNIIASLAALLQELQVAEAGEEAGAVEPEMTPEVVEPPVSPVEDDEEVMMGMDEDESDDEEMSEVDKEEPTDEVANSPAEERIADEEGNDVDGAVQKALARMLGLVKKSAPKPKSAMQEMVTVMKSLVSKSNRQDKVMEDLLAGLGVSNEIQKSIKTNKVAKNTPYAQSSNSQQATLNYLAKALSDAKTTESPEESMNSVRKDLSDIMPALLKR